MPWHAHRDRLVEVAAMLGLLVGSLGKLARDIALSHHEKFDGSGYPYGLSGEKIPLCGRIVALSDVYDALTTARVYKPAFSHEVAKDIILEGRGKHFDTNVLDAFFSRRPEILRTQLAHAEVD